MVFGPVTRAVGAGIGFTAEARRYYKEQHGGRSPSPNAFGDGGSTRNERAEEVTPSDQAVQVDNQSKPNASSFSLPYEEMQYMVDDEEDWALDEAGDKADRAHGQTIELQDDIQDDCGPNEKDQDEAAKNIRKITLTCLNDHPAPVDPANHKPLPYPIILPHRRPRNRSRGFI